MGYYSSFSVSQGLLRSLKLLPARLLPGYKSGLITRNLIKPWNPLLHHRNILMLGLGSLSRAADPASPPHHTTLQIPMSRQTQAHRTKPPSPGQTRQCRKGKERMNRNVLLPPSPIPGSSRSTDKCWQKRL